MSSTYKNVHPPSVKYGFVGEFIVNGKLSRVNKINIGRYTHYYVSNKDEMVFYLKDTNERWYMSLNPMINRINELPEGNGYVAKSQITDMQIDIITVNQDATNRDQDLTIARDFLSSIKMPDGQKIEIGYLQKGDISARHLSTYDNINELLRTCPIILCLTINDHCVSSIEMLEEDDPTFIEIRSKTDSRHRKKYYNTMLRAITILLIPLIWTNALHLISYATNPNTVLTMVNRFNGITKNSDIEGKTRDEIKQYMSGFEQGQSIPIVLPLTNETLEHAKQTLYELKL